MSHEFGPGDGPGPDHESPDSTASDETYAKTETGEPRMVDRSASGERLADRDEAFSLVDPLFYAPLLLVGAALVVFPEPLTSVVGVLCIAAGLSIAVVDLLSPDDPG